VRGEVSGHARATRGAEALCQRFVAQQPAYRRRESRCIARWNQQPGLAVHDRFVRAADGGGNHRLAGRHGLEHADRQSFEQRRQYDEIAARE
jgi:hypothetical protein